jgi:hypothetical protein
MTTGQKGSKFYVVGGPVQPDRDCYVVRDADATLYARLSDGDYCHVLAPHHVGKSSLMAHAASRLRADGAAVATVDLTQITHRDPAEDAGRWYYSVAYRIVRELRIKADMQSWWRERSGLTNMQRLRDFFLDLVLAQTDRRVVVFVDGVEAALSREVAGGLIHAIRACYDARATEPEYERLTFALLGSATVGQLVPAGEDSPFDVSTAIALPDFDKEEIRRLTAGLACDPSVARLVADRVYQWTSGHPYLSQKTLRALSRRRTDELEAADVDAVVNTLFFGRNATREETHLSAVAGELLSESPRKVARLTLYGRVRKSGPVSSDPVSEAQRELLRSGVVVENTAGDLVVRNAVYAESLTPRWVNQHLPFGLRGVAVAAAIILVIVAIPVWYTEYLPRPYIRQLTTPNQDYVTALNAYERLSFLPGFGAIAEQLFSDFLARQSRRATRLPEVRRFTDQLAEIPGRQLLAAELLAEYWDRQSAVFMRRGDRDPALLFARRALDIPTDERRSQVTELLGSDFRYLRATLRTREPLRALELDADSGLITTLDEQHVASVWQLNADGLRQLQTIPLLAEEVVPLQRRLVFDGETTGRRLRLTVRTDHPRPSDIVVELRAPSGRQIRMALGSRTAPAEPGVFRFDSRRDRALRSLLEENVNGTWTAYFTDQVQGVGGVLLDWSLQVQDAAATAPAGAGQDPAPIPEPGVARQAASELAAGGGLALTWPADPAVRGDILVWNVASGEAAARIPRPAGFIAARFALGDSAVLIIAARKVELWHTGRAELLQSIPIEPSLVPVLSANGRYLVVDSILGEAGNALAVWDLAERKEIGRLVTGALAELVATDSSGRYLAVGDGDRLVRLWSIRDGQLIAEFEHGAAPVSIDFDATGTWLATQDAAHALLIWQPADGTTPVITRQASSFWNTSFSAGYVLLGSLDQGYEVLRLPEGSSLGPVLHHGVPPDRDAPAQPSSGKCRRRQTACHPAMADRREYTRQHSTRPDVNSRWRLGRATFAFCQLVSSRCCCRARDANPHSSVTWPQSRC